MPASGAAAQIERQLLAAGGCKRAVVRGQEADTDRGRGFVKTGTGGASAARALLDYEAEGLRRLREAAAGALAVPEVWLVGDIDGDSFIVMEHLQLGGGGGRDAGAALGRGLARIHKAPVDWQEGKSFGFPVDGCCGAAPQPNAADGSCQDWVTFWRKHRLGHQLALAKARHPEDTKLQELGKRLGDVLPELFSMLDQPVRPSLLHGDLWSGNWGVTGSGAPCIFDPAAYYGHDEADLGIAHMFGGFPDSFWDAYHREIPKRKGFVKRALLYELHHHLNHYNIFGAGYRSGCIGLMERLLRP
eukprot:TRINITY_DN65441_c0_g1_i1.p1 TRINITY_DN65441_c0_g1~~TRINITY_DN65441_c0_g1_i1.p1  ORF type:complete len:302 (+),score=76.72 TRINITY_DN65441_c0_g1_i1:67-972(+)